MPLSDAEWVSRLNRKVPPTAILMGMEVLEVDQQHGRCRIRFEGKPEFCNPMGTIQGGFVAAMLDDAAAIAAIVMAPQRIVVPTLEFKVSFFSAARPGPLFATGQCLKLGRTAAFLSSELHDAGGRLLATMSATALPQPLGDTPNFVERET